MAIADSEEMKRGQTLDVWRQNILVLVNFVRVMRMISNTSGKCELSNAVFTLFVVLFLGARWILISLCLVL